MTMSSETTSSTGYNIETLTDYNYHSWAQQMELILNEKELWKVVNDTCPTSVETATMATTTMGTADLKRKRKKATALIMSTVSSRVLSSVPERRKDPSTIWTILKHCYILRTRIMDH
jgi:Domain of unknown function (DUF4219)